MTHASKGNTPSESTRLDLANTEQEVPQSNLPKTRRKSHETGGQAHPSIDHGRPVPLYPTAELTAHVHNEATPSDHSSAHGRSRRSRKRGLHRENKEGPSDSWPASRPITTIVQQRSMGVGVGAGQKQLGCMVGRRSRRKGLSYMMRSLHTYIHTYAVTDTQRHTYIADKRQAARQEVLHTNLHTHGNRHASVPSATGQHVPDSPSPGLL